MYKFRTLIFLYLNSNYAKMDWAKTASSQLKMRQKFNADRDREKGVIPPLFPLL